jgi:S-adenosylmethionine decarboxylase
MAGIEWLVEAFDCDAAALADVAKLQALAGALIRDLPLHPVCDPVWHRFPEPGGVTGLVLLAESHLAIHTFPEHGSLTLNLFCCRPRPDWDFATYLRRDFGAGEVAVRKLERPYARGGGSQPADASQAASETPRANGRAGSPPQAAGPPHSEARR